MPYSTGRIVILLAILLPFLAVLPFRARRSALLAASLMLYAAENPATHFALLCAVTLAAFVTARIIEKIASSSHRRAALMTGIVVILGPLFTFKLATLIEGNRDVGRIPLGLAFVSLALAGYVVEVFRRTIPSQPLIATFAFGTFFPVVPAGPIPRAPVLMPQLENPLPLSPERFSQACRQILWGVFLKLVVADRLALIIDRLDASAASGSSAAVLGAAYAYSFQLYADFSAYSEIAIGLAAMCGVTLAKNFDRPYFSASLGEFWRRWHISLSSWLRDYVYFPLGGSRVAPRIPAEAIEEAVVGRICEISRSVESRERIVERALSCLGSESEKLRQEEDMLRRQQQKTKADIGRLVEVLKNLGAKALVSVQSELSRLETEERSLERQLKAVARRQEPLERITDDATIFIHNWGDVAELLDAATDEERTQLLRHYVEVVELHADDPEGRTGTYALRLFPEVRPDQGFEWPEDVPEPPGDGSAGLETTNGDAIPKDGTAVSLTDSRLVCISDGKAPRAQPFTNHSLCFLCRKSLIFSTL